MQPDDELGSVANRITAFGDNVEELQRRVAALEQEMRTAANERRSAEAALRQAERDLRALSRSRTWRLVSTMHRVRRIVSGGGKRRAEPLQKVLDGIERSRPRDDAGRRDPAESLVPSAKPARRPAQSDVRHRFLDSHAEVDRTCILEVGALDDPMFQGPRDLDVRYLDWFSRQELVATYKDHDRRNAEALVDVDYVVKRKRFADAIPERFSLIVANHVIEHVADPITWLEQLAIVARPGGHLFLSVPDRRFTFDYLRPASTVVQLLRAHEEDLARPDVWQILESRFHHRPLRINDFVDGQPPAAKLAQRRMKLDQGFARARVAAETYADVHCFVYTGSSFGAIVSDLREAGMLSWQPIEVTDVEPGLNEFHVLLRRD